MELDTVLTVFFSESLFSFCFFFPLARSLLLTFTTLSNNWLDSRILT